MKCNCLRLKSPLPEREGTTKTKIWAGLSWFCICACSKRDWGRRCPRPSSQPSTPLPATFPVAGTDGLCTMHGRAQPKTHHPHRLSSRFHTPTPLNGLCLKEGKQNKTKKKHQKKKKHTAHLCFLLCGLWFQPNRATGHSNISKTAFASVLCPPCPSPLWCRCSAGVPSPPLLCQDCRAWPHRCRVGPSPCPAGSHHCPGQVLGRSEDTGEQIKASPRSRCERGGEGPKKLLPSTCLWSSQMGHSVLFWLS